VNEGTLRRFEKLLFDLREQSWELVLDTAEPFVRVKFPTGAQETMHMTRDEPDEIQASVPEPDVRFIGRSLEDARYLVDTVRGRRETSDSLLAEIESRIYAASPAPWQLFLESEGGIGGPTIIWVPLRDGVMADMYLSFGSNSAPDEVWKFVSEARDMIPELLEAARTPPDFGGESARL
jgi:hypothetical protein